MQEDHSIKDSEHAAILCQHPALLTCVHVQEFLKMKKKLPLSLGYDHLFSVGACKNLRKSWAHPIGVVLAGGLGNKHGMASRRGDRCADAVSWVGPAAGGMWRDMQRLLQNELATKAKGEQVAM